MPRILIAGCGYVGEATANLFHSAGWNVEGWVHSKESAARLSVKPYSVRVIDVSQRGDVAKRREAFDAVIHCASSRGGDAEAYREIYLNGALHLLETFPRAKILFTSSTSVYAQRDGSKLTEESETKPLRETSQILLQVEKLVLEKGGIVKQGGKEAGEGLRSANVAENQQDSSRIGAHRVPGSGDGSPGQRRQGGGVGRQPGQVPDGFSQGRNSHDRSFLGKQSAISSQQSAVSQKPRFG